MPGCPAGGGWMDIVAELRGFEIDHEPDGWPGVRMRQISALCDETDRLRDMLRPEWNEEGEAMTLASAAEDADEWLALIERLHNDGLGPWKFSDAHSLDRLRGCRRALRHFLVANASFSGATPAGGARCSESPGATGYTAFGRDDE